MRRVCVSLLLFAACEAPLPETAAETNLVQSIPHAAPCTGAVAVVFSPAGAQKLTEVTAITITVTPTRTCRPEAISVELVSPKGNPYEVRTAPMQGARAAVFQFPVAGTPIAQRGLFGPWAVRAFIDGAPLPSTGFDLDR